MTEIPFPAQIIFSIGAILVFAAIAITVSHKSAPKAVELIPISAPEFPSQFLILAEYGDRFKKGQEPTTISLIYMDSDRRLTIPSYKVEGKNVVIEDCTLEFLEAMQRDWQNPKEKMMLAMNYNQRFDDGYSAPGGHVSIKEPRAGALQ